MTGTTKALTTQKVAAILRKAGFESYQAPKGAYKSVKGRTQHTTSARPGFQCAKHLTCIALTHQGRGDNLEQYAVALEQAGVTVERRVNNGYLYSVDIPIEQ